MQRLKLILGTGMLLVFLAHVSSTSFVHAAPVETAPVEANLKKTLPLLFEDDFGKGF